MVACTPAARRRGSHEAYPLHYAPRSGADACAAAGRVLAGGTAGLLWPVVPGAPEHGDTLHPPTPRCRRGGVPFQLLPSGASACVREVRLGFRRLFKLPHLVPQRGASAHDGSG
jgi:hypothetical protein